MRSITRNHKSQYPFDAGGFHSVAASDDAISKIVAALKDTFKVEIIAPGHCTGEPTFAALKQAFGDHYIYAGLGTSLATGSGAGAKKDAVKHRRSMPRICQLSQAGCS